jgi:CRISPR-associated protein Cas6
MEKEPKVDLCFSITGKTIPVDHGFELYSAICSIIPEFHEAEDAGMKLIRGRYIGDGLLDIHPNSWLIIRLKTSDLHRYINLAGKTLSLKEHIIQVAGHEPIIVFLIICPIKLMRKMNYVRPVLRLWNHGLFQLQFALPTPFLEYLKT